MLDKRELVSSSPCLLANRWHKLKSLGVHCCPTPEARGGDSGAQASEGLIFQGQLGVLPCPPRGNVRSTKLRESCWGQGPRELGQQEQAQRRLRNLLGLSLSWAVWEGKGLQRGRKASAPGVKAQPVQQAGDPVWINEREGDN